MGVEFLGDSTSAAAVASFFFNTLEALGGKVPLIWGCLGSKEQLVITRRKSFVVSLHGRVTQTHLRSGPWVVREASDKVASACPATGHRTSSVGDCGPERQSQAEVQEMHPRQCTAYLLSLQPCLG